MQTLFVVVTHSLYLSWISLVYCVDVRGVALGFVIEILEKTRRELALWVILQPCSCVIHGA